MPKPVYAAVLFVLLAGLACSGTTGRACGGEGRPSCASLTVTASRNAAWDEYCSTQEGCADASEGLVVLMGPKSASSYAEYDPAHLACSDVTFSMKDGSTETHHFIVLDQENRESFEVIEEAQIESCLGLEQ